MANEFCKYGSLGCQIDNRRGKALSIARDKQFPEELALVCMVGMTKALYHIHKLGWAHQDLKPDNILLSEDECKLGDFGSAGIVPEGGKVLESKVGTFSYMSPEMRMEQRTGPAADIYGVGLIVFEMLTGVNPFKG